MAGVAALAREAGWTVSGQDQGVYAPMSDQLDALGVAVAEGYDPADIPGDVDLVVIGNALSRGNPAVEYVLEADLAYTSGPRWLGEHFLRGRRVVAVAGTHGKTTSSAMLTWILERAGLEPGYLIGGLPSGFATSARQGSGPFVVEADEYDTACFDKRAKFVHYRPRVAVLNNLEYDHADIYSDLAAIQTQFHHLVRTIPGNGVIVANGDDPAIETVLDRGAWTPVQRVGTGTINDWRLEPQRRRGAPIRLRYGKCDYQWAWTLCGEHNARNGAVAIAAAQALGVAPADAAQALAIFPGVRRRLEQLGSPGGIHVYDDFAHHPTAIRATLEGLRQRIGGARLLLALEPRSNTMRSGHHVDALAPAMSSADLIAIHTGPDVSWDPRAVLQQTSVEGRSFHRIEDMLRWLRQHARAGDHVVFMSNGAFGDAPARFVQGFDQGST